VSAAAVAPTLFNAPNLYFLAPPSGETPAKDLNAAFKAIKKVVGPPIIAVYNSLEKCGNVATPRIKKAVVYCRAKLKAVIQWIAKAIVNLAGNCRAKLKVLTAWIAKAVDKWRARLSTCLDASKRVPVQCIGKCKTVLVQVRDVTKQNRVSPKQESSEGKQEEQEPREEKEGEQEPSEERDISWVEGYFDGNNEAQKRRSVSTFSFESAARSEAKQEDGEEEHATTPAPGLPLAEVGSRLAGPPAPSASERQAPLPGPPLSGVRPQLAGPPAPSASERQAPLPGPPLSGVRPQLAGPPIRSGGADPAPSSADMNDFLR
jgi:hypothetical protein